MLLEKVIAVVVEIAIKLELEVEPKDVIESLSISWGIFSEWGVAFYKWLKKVVSWDIIYSYLFL